MESNKCQWKKLPLLSTTLEKLNENNTWAGKGMLSYIFGCVVSQCKISRKQFDRQSPNQ